GSGPFASFARESLKTVVMARIIGSSGVLAPRSTGGAGQPKGAKPTPRITGSRGMRIMDRPERPSHLNFFLRAIAPAVLLPGCAAGVIGIAAIAGSSGGGWGGTR